MHTPTPWFQYQDHTDSFDWDVIKITNQDRHDGSYVEVARIPSVDDDGGFANEQRANAALIIKSVNALSEAIELLTAVAQSDGKVSDLLFNQIQAALKKWGEA